MLEILINQQALNIHKPISFTFINPIFDKDGIARSYSYPFNIPASASTQKIFKHTNRLDVSDVSEKEAAILRLFQSDLPSGYVVHQQQSSTQYSCNYISDARNLADELKKVKIKDLFDSTINLATSNPARFNYELYSPYTNNIIRIRINDVDYEFTINTGSPELPQDILNNIKSQIDADYPDAVVSVGLAGINGAYIDITAQPQQGEFRIIPNAGSGTHDLSIISERQQHIAIAEQWQADLEANLLLSTANANYRFPTFYNRKLYTRKENLIWRGVVNERISGSFPLNPSSDTPEDWDYTISPQLSLRYVIDEIAEELGFDLDGDALSVLDDLLIYNNQTLDYEIKDKDDDYYNVYAPSYKLSDFLPDITAYELITKVQKSLFVYFTFDSDTLFFNAINTPLQKPAIDLTQYIDPEYGVVTPSTSGFNVRMLEDEKDQESQPADYVQSVIGEDYQIIGTLAESNSYNIVQHPINDDFRLRLIHYDGVHATFNKPTSSSYTTPTAAHNSNKKYLKLLYEGKPVTLLAALPPHLISQLVQYENPVIRVGTDNGSIQGVVRKIQFKVDNIRLSKTRLEVVFL